MKHSAVAVNPEDELQKDISWQDVKAVPLTDREIPVIADERYVDKEFGTGCVKSRRHMTRNDFEVGKRHNLEEICIMNDDATISVPGKYQGMDRYEARKAMVEDLKEMGLLVKVVPHSHNVGTHDRCGTTVEPMVKPQWFVKMEMKEPAVGAPSTDLNSFRRALERPICTGSRASVTGVFPVSSGGDTGFRHIIVMTAAR